MGSATIKDVAKLAGVSATTVSHVINKSRFVSPGTKARVVEAMRELNYQPNAVARSLRMKTSNTIGLIISDISNPFFTNLVRGVEDVANSKGKNLILCNTDEKTEKEETYLRILRQKQVDGIIMAPTGGPLEFLRQLIEVGFPLVFIDRLPDGIQVPTVTVNNEKASCDAVRHLTSLGHVRIGVVTGMTGISSTVERMKGYERALSENGIETDERLVVEGWSRVEGGYDAAMRLLSLKPRPTAIFATNNLMTIGVMRALRDCGLRCPEDMSVVGFDDFDWASAFHPYLTTVAQPVYELGATAANLLFKRMKARRMSGNPARVVLEARLIVRESTAVPPSET